MTSRRFAPLFWRQFFSAFNDNFVRNMLAMLILFRFGGENISLKICSQPSSASCPRFPFPRSAGRCAGIFGAGSGQGRLVSTAPPCEVCSR
jgi:hypothetical protein